MLLRRLLSLGPRPQILLRQLCLSVQDSVAPPCRDDALVLSNETTKIFSCSFTTVDVMGSHQHSIASTPAMQLARFREKIATAVNLNRRRKVTKAIKKGTCPAIIPEDVTVALTSVEGQPLDGETSLDEAFQDGCVLRIGSQFFSVVRNPPAVSHLKVTSAPLRGCPVFATFTPVFCDHKDCEVQWFLRAKQSKTPPPATANWDLAHRGPYAIFDSPEAVGQWVKVRVVPRDLARGRTGLCLEKVIGQPLREGPFARSPIQHRHALTGERTGPSELRVVSYNLLADIYAGTDFARNNLFPFCPPQFLDYQYRQQLILRELLGYNADLICLQEVDKSFFEGVLRPFFTVDGQFGASFLPKWNMKREGVAVLFRRSKLELVEDVSLPSLSEALPQVLGGDLAEDAAACSAFYWRWSGLTQMLQGLVLRSVQDSDKLLLAANTHLYSLPSAGHIRLLQAAVCLKHLELAREAALQNHGAASCALMFAGDFNSQPTTGVFRLATEGRLPATTADWFSGGRGEVFAQCEVHHSLRLRSLYDVTGGLCVTNFVPLFCGTLDYIFFDERDLAVKRTVPLPSLRELQDLTALPSEFFPSDHVALVGDLAWK